MALVSRRGLSSAPGKQVVASEISLHEAGMDQHILSQPGHGASAGTALRSLSDPPLNREGIQTRLWGSEGKKKREKEERR